MADETVGLVGTGQQMSCKHAVHRHRGETFQALYICGPVELLSSPPAQVGVEIPVCREKEVSGEPYDPVEEAKLVDDAPVRMTRRMDNLETVPAGIDDIAVYHRGFGLWYAVSLAKGAVLAWGESWGYLGTVPVPGDYNADGITDLAVYDPATGSWYVRTLGGEVMAYPDLWGGPGFIPLPADVDGDGATDLVVYDPVSGNWYDHNRM